MTTPPYTERDLRNDWLDALAILKATRPEVDMNLLYPRTDLKLDADKRWYAVVTLFKGGPPAASPRNCIFWLGRQITDFYKVERVEILLYAACRAWVWIHYGDHRDYAPELTPLCRQTGCVPVNYPHPEQRWLLLPLLCDGWMDLPVVRAHEDRPKCGICSIPVGTGHRRKDAHDGCVAYAVQHIYPDLRERRAAAHRMAAEAVSAMGGVGDA